MTDITEARNNIQEEEASFRAGVSEAFAFKIGESVNFINKRQLFVYNFNLNGPYQGAAGQTGLEGFYMFLFDFEIVGMGVNNTVPGTSGTTTFDVHKISGGGTDDGTIFSTKPSISTAAGANAYALRQFLPSVSDVVTAAGITLPSLTTTSFSTGDAFRFDVDAAMVDAQNASLLVMYRPR